MPSMACVPLVCHPCYRACLGRSWENCFSSSLSENHLETKNYLATGVGLTATTTSCPACYDAVQPVWLQEETVTHIKQF
ncbi:hypothetical protein TNCV_2461231 [Trichonephila clavipes]|nr:hypothetical protein TNCV_2461231 [Trichonephila clavipes]